MTLDKDLTPGTSFGRTVFGRDWWQQFVGWMVASGLLVLALLWWRLEQGEQVQAQANIAERNQVLARAAALLQSRLDPLVTTLETLTQALAADQAEMARSGLDVQEMRARMTFRMQLAMRLRPEINALLQGGKDAYHSLVVVWRDGQPTVVKVSDVDLVRYKFSTLEFERSSADVYVGPIQRKSYRGRVIEPPIWSVEVMTVDRAVRAGQAQALFAELDVSSIFNNMLETIPPDIPIRLVDQNGEWLYAETFDRADPQPPVLQMPDLWKAMQAQASGGLDSAGQQWLWQRVSLRSVTQSAAQQQQVYILSGLARSDQPALAQGRLRELAGQTGALWLIALLLGAGGLTLWRVWRDPAQALQGPFRALIDAQHAALLVMRSDGTTLFANPAAQAWLALGLDQVIAGKAPLQAPQADGLEALAWTGTDGVQRHLALQSHALQWARQPAWMWVLTDRSLDQLAQARLQAAEKGLQQLLIHAVYRPDQRIAAVNDAYCLLNGFSREGLLGKSLAELRSNEIFSSVDIQTLWQELMHGNWVRRSFHRLDDDGQVKYVEALYLPLMGASGELEQVHFWAQDVSELEHLRLTLLATEQRYRAYMDTALESMVVYDQTGLIVDVNRAALVMLGQSKPRLLMRNVSNFMVDVDLSRLRTAWAAAQDGSERDLSPTLRDAQGQVFPVLGRVRCVVVQGRKWFIATGRSLAQEQAVLKDLSGQQRALDASAMVLQLDGQGRFVKANAMWLERFCPNPEALKDRLLLQYCPPDLISAAGTPHRDVARSEMQLKGSQGDIVHVNAVAYQVFGADGMVEKTIVLSWDITQQVQTRLGLQRSEARFRGFVHSSDDGYWMLNESGQLLDANQALCTLLGYTHHELVGMTFTDLDKGMRSRDIRSQLASSSEPLASQRYESTLRHKQGDLIPVDVRTTIQRQGGQVVYMAVMRDLRSLRSQQRHMVQLRDAIDRTHLMLELDAEGFFKSANAAFLKRFGRLASELRNRPIKGYDLSDLRTRLNQSMSRMNPAGDHGSVEGPGGLSTWESEHQTLAGESIWLRNTVSVLQDDVSAETSYVILAIDITASVRARQELERAKELTQTYMEFSPIGLFVHDMYGNFTEANRAFCDILGMRREEILSLSILDVEVALPVDELANLWHHMSMDRMAHVHHGRGRRRDGSEVEWTITLGLVEVAGERVFLGSAQDMTAEKATQRVLERQQQALDSSHMSLTLTPDGRIMDANAKWLDRMGYTMPDVLGHTLQGAGLFASQDSEHAAQSAHVLERARAGEAVQKELCWRDRSGESVWVLASYYPSLDGAGVCESVAVLGLDISAQKAGEARLRESQKLEAIGQLTGGLAHDFNNMLGIVVGNLDLIEEGLPADDQMVQESFYAARDAAMRGASVAHALLAVARRQKMDLALTDINDLLGGLLGLLATSAGTRVNLRSQLTAEPLMAWLDASGLSNVLLNLVINARDAMAERSGDNVIELRTQKVHVQVDESRGLNPGDYCLISLQDNGTGMEPVVMQRAFDPFFTTKEQGKGTGLGLAMVRGYAEQLGGLARIESTLGVGTTVSVMLPLAVKETHAYNRAESERLQALHALNLLDAPTNPELESLVQEAATVLGVPMAVISLVDEKRQWFAAKVGLDVDETPRDVAFCDHAIRSDEPVYEVHDAQDEVAFSANALVTGAPHIRFYAGVPLRDDQGHGLGTFCVLDARPRALDAAQRQALQALAARARAIMLQGRPEAPPPDVAQDRADPLMPPQQDETGDALADEALAAEALPVPSSGGTGAVDRSGLDPAGPAVRVLVVDDEPGLCRIACKWLTQLGAQAEGCYSADEALALLEQQPFDVLFSDILMPGNMDGLALAEAALQRYPQLKVMLATGFAPSVHERQAMPVPVLNKPYRKDDLRVLLQDLSVQARPGSGPEAP